MEKKPKITIIGLSGESIFLKVDHFHETGETLKTSNMHVEPGGKGFNQAIAAARFGAECSFITPLGSDEYGQECIKVLQENNVKPLPVIKEKSCTTRAVILTDRLGENQVTVALNATSLLTINDLMQYKSELLASDAIIVQLEIPLQVNKYLINFAKENNIPVFLNPAPACKWQEEFGKVSLLIPNESEAHALFNITKEDNLTDKLQKISAKMHLNVCVTLGKNGSLIINNGELIEVSSVSTTAVDTTGAGDVFCGVLVVQLLQDKSLTEAANIASAAAAYCVNRPFVIDAIPHKTDIIKEE